MSAFPSVSAGCGLKSTCLHSNHVSEHLLKPCVPITLGYKICRKKLLAQTLGTVLSRLSSCFQYVSISLWILSSVEYDDTSASAVTIILMHYAVLSRSSKPYISIKSKCRKYFFEVERSLSVTHLTAFDTVDQSRVGIPLETSSADDPLQRDGETGIRWVWTGEGINVCWHRIKSPHLFWTIQSWPHPGIYLKKLPRNLQ